MKIDWRDDISNDLRLNLQEALRLKNRLRFVDQMIKDLSRAGRFGSCYYCKRFVSFRGHKEGCELLGFIS